MKNRNRLLYSLRFIIGGAFFAAAAALAFVAATTTVLTTHDNVAATKSHLQIQDSVRGVGSEKSKDGSFIGPNLAAARDIARRAYPNKGEVPFSLKLNALNSFKNFMAPSGSAASTSPQAGRKGPPEPSRFHNWSLVGPSNSQVPNLLTFSGGPSVASGRITALALDTLNSCTPSFCRLWVGAAGGGVWTTTNALAASPTWRFLTQLNFSTNAIGSLAFFNNGTANGALYAGTGEANTSADSEAGLGLFVSFDGGNSWTQLPCNVGPITTFSPAGGGAVSPNGTYTGNAFFGRGITSIVVDPNNPFVLYVSTGRGFRGVDSTDGGATSNPPRPRPPFGLFKSTDGGKTFSFIWDGSATCPGSCNGSDLSASVIGVNEVKLDPSNSSIVYASAFPGNNGTGGGVWRSSNGGITWTQIKTAQIPGDVFDRMTFDVTTLPSSDTRMYVGGGNTGAHVFRSDLVETGVPAFTDLTAAEAPAGQSTGYCGGQCSYDNVVVTSQEFPDVVFIGGSFTYTGPQAFGRNSNGRAVLASDTAGTSWFDWTWDGQDNGMPPGQCCNPNQFPAVGPAPNGMHPDHHALVIVPGTFASIIFDGSDGGLVRTDGAFQNISGQCTGVRTTDGTVSNVPLCQQLLSIVPNKIINMNTGLATLQFQSLSIAANNAFHLQGGTQDNGTWDNTSGPITWNQIIYGDGGQSGFNVNDSTKRFNSFFFQQHDGNFRNGSPAFWVILSGPIFASVEATFSEFYPAIIADPNLAAAGTILEGSRHVWRTQDWGGSQAFLEANCPEFTTSSANPACGDFVPLGGAAGFNNAGDLSGTFYGGDRTFFGVGDVCVIARTTTNTNTAWAGTTGGRVFISTNVDNPTANAVLWNRLDADIASSKDPTRFPTGIVIDPTNVFHAWVTYSGYTANTPNQPGHIFSVTWSGAGSATWTNVSNNLPDIPLTSVAFDPVRGDLYVSSDFTVFRLAAGQTMWDIAGTGLPLVEVPNLQIAPGSRVLYAATHGLSAWTLPLY